MKKYFIHIGFPRTATTFLQKKIFPSMEDFTFIGPPYTFFNHAFQHLLFADDTFYDKKWMENEIYKWPGDQILISDENLVGQPLYHQFGNRTRTANRLKYLFPEAEIIIFLRGQIDLLSSQYGIGVQGGILETPEDFISLPGKNYTWEDYRSEKRSERDQHSFFEPQKPKEFPAGYCYSPLLKLYTSLFQKVHIFLYEDLVLDQRKTLGKLFSKVESKSAIPVVSSNKINRGLSKENARKIVSLNRWEILFKKNKIMMGIISRLKRKYINAPQKEKITFSPAKEEYLNELFSRDNLILASQYPELELERFAPSYLLPIDSKSPLPSPK